MSRCAVTGSFDPITLGHLDVIKHARTLYDEVVVLMLINPDKQYTFGVKSRMDMINLTIANMDGVSADYYEGITADYCKPRGITTLIRGVRDKKDLLYEKELAGLNADFGLKTVFVDANLLHATLSSTLVRENLDKGIYDGLPTAVVHYLKQNPDIRRK